MGTKRTALLVLAGLAIEVLAVANVTAALVVPQERARSDAVTSEVTASLREEVALATTQRNERAQASSTTSQIGAALSTGNIISTIKTDQTDCTKYQRAWREMTDSATCSFKITSGRGDFKQLIVQLVSPYLDQSSYGVNQIITTLNSEQDIVAVSDRYIPTNVTKVATYNYFKTFFEAQAKKFAVSGFSWQVDKTKPIIVDSLPSMKNATSDDVDKWWASSDEMVARELNKTGVDFHDYDVINVVIFLDSGSLLKKRYSPDSRVSVLAKGLVDGAYPYYTIQAITTFMGMDTVHLIGATDSCGDKKDSFMAARERSLVCNQASLNDYSEYFPYAGINSQTARDLGWIK